MTQLVLCEIIGHKGGRDLFLATGELIEVTANRAAALTDLAVAAGRIDEAKVEDARQWAEERLLEKLSDEEIAAINASMARAAARLHLKRRARR